MTYAEGRLVYDADSHIHEPPGYAESYADPGIRAQLAERLATFRRPPGVEEGESGLPGRLHDAGGLLNVRRDDVARSSDLDSGEKPEGEGMRFPRNRMGLC